MTKRQLVGEFGSWLVLGPVPSCGGMARWLCRCKCGVERIVFAKTLLNGESQSCGCVPTAQEKRKTQL